MPQHFTSLDGVWLENTWLTIGSFDGVHLGHQQLIRELNFHAHQAGAKSVVLTFHPHPTVVLRGRKGALYLTTVAEKVEILVALGTDIVVTHPFTHEISQSTAREFISYLFEHLGFKQLWIGHDFALGKGREGNVDCLKQLGSEYNYLVNIIDPIASGGRTISSSYIRHLLSIGSIEEANLLLGRLYQVSGRVIHGDGRGKSIGIPTANLDTGDEKLIPGAGVYACQGKISGKMMPAAVNIGTRPTFDSSDLQSHVEAHLLDFDGDLYDQYLSLSFVTRLRGEQRFDSVDELINQVHLDINKTREIVTELTRS